MPPVFPIGHRRRGAGQTLDMLPEIERGMVLSRHRGNTWYVDSNAAAGGNGNTWAGAFRLLQTAIDASAADDTIFVAPLHAESVVAAGGIALNKAGISIIGFGNGRRRPVITLATLTTATITVTAANITVSNIIITSTIAALVKVFNVTAAGLTLDQVDYFEDGTTDCLQFVLTTAAAVDLQIMNCRWYRGTTAATALSQWIVLTGADRARIVNNYLILKGFATANPINSAIAVVTTFCVGVEIVGNRFYDSNSTGNTSILMLASTTGVIAFNCIGTSKTGTPGSVTPASCFAFENYAVNEVAKAGFLDPAADTT